MLRRSECDFRVAHGRLIFSCWGERGAAAWRINAWEWTGQKLLLEASRRAGAEGGVRLELIPRASLAALNAMVSATRRELCERLARLACALRPGAVVERASLSAGARRGQPGSFARIVLRRGARERIAVTGTVAAPGKTDVDGFLSSALVWFTRACEKTQTPSLHKLWLVGDESSEALAGRLSLLRRDLRRVISLFRIDQDWRALAAVELPEPDELWSARPLRFRRRPPPPVSRSAAEIIALAPDAIDVVRTRQGETLRFHGLAFARVRRLMKTESTWFGTEGAPGRRLLDESTKEEWTGLLRSLREHRHAGASDRQHALYKAAPEAWLESLLRRDITRLDPGLILAPLYAQFRTAVSDAAGSRPVDLLALRRDGRLVVIELKVSADREHVIQGADYWRRVEIGRRSGRIRAARLFGDAVIADLPPLVYLVAPMLGFHRAYQTLARCISPRIELYRFDLGEDWRAGPRVMRRGRSN
jgi:hypothetical protein